MKFQAVAYNWTRKATLGDDILKVCSLVVPTLRETSLTTSQKHRDSFTDVHWMSGIVTIMPAETVISKRNSTLRYLKFIRNEITGSRGLVEPTELGMVTNIDKILEEVAVEAYLQVLNDAWRVIPSRFFRVVDSGAAGMVDFEAE